MNRIVLFIIVLCFGCMLPFVAKAHQSGCHRWHSCESDRGTYTCGDTGYCSQCSNNYYCKDGVYKPGWQEAAQKAADAAKAKKAAAVKRQISVIEKTIHTLELQIKNEQGKPAKTKAAQISKDKKLKALQSQLAAQRDKLSALQK